MNKMTYFGNEESSNKVSSAEVGKSKFAFGIDLGTTNSAISVIVTGNEPRIISLVNSKHTMPSCVMYDGKTDSFVVGYQAYKNRGHENVIYSVKSFMQDPDKKIVLTDNGKSVTLTPTEVSAEILKGLVKEVGDTYGEIHDVVVTVPAMFNDIGKKHTAEACKLAGLNLLGILTEPTAASLCYDITQDKEQQKDILVYDLGGGTFDVSLIRVSSDCGVSDDFADIYGLSTGDVINNKSVLVVGNGGNPKLGGDDIDKELYKIVTAKLQRDGVDLSKLSNYDREKILLTLESLKKSGVNATYRAVFNVHDADGKEVEITTMITPDMFKAALEPIYHKTREIIEQVIRESYSQVSTIVLVGGSTKSPFLKQMLKEDYPSFSINDRCEPDESVSLGAAIQAKNLKFGDAGVSVTDSLPIGIGIKESGRLLQLIKKNKPFPTSSYKDFTTMVDNQTSIDVDIYQGDTFYLEEAVMLGRLHIDDIPASKSGDVIIRVILEINANGLLKCKTTISHIHGEFNSITKSLELNLSGLQNDATVKSLSRDEKLVCKWTKFAEKLDHEAKQQLLDLISGFPNIVDKKTIMTFIQDHAKIEGLKDESK